MKKARKHLTKESKLETQLLAWLFPHFPAPIRNYKPFKKNNLEFDFCWLREKIAIEVNGGIDHPGRRSGHVSRDGIRRDYYKSNLAQLDGWILLSFPPEYCKDPVYFNGLALPFLRRAFKMRTPT